MLITIGSFDGFHRGHSELLDICRRNADGDNWGVVTFYPHPSEFLGSMRHSLFTLEERELIRRVLGIPHMNVLKFDEAMMNLTPEEFWALLRERFNVDGLVMGSDFHFGRGRSGNAECLKSLAEHDGLRKIFIADLLDKPIYSSSNVRECISAGSMNIALEILGYPFLMMSRVIHGSERGRTMNFPTANLDIHEGRVIPAWGVYCCAVLANNEWHCGAMSIGNNPTFHDVRGTRAEVHILGFSGNIYGDELLVLMLGRVRDIITFADKEALISRITKDTETCRKIYGEVMGQEDTLKFVKRIEEVYSSHKTFTPEIIKLI